MMTLPITAIKIFSKLTTLLILTLAISACSAPKPTINLREPNDITKRLNFTYPDVAKMRLGSIDFDFRIAPHPQTYSFGYLTEQLINVEETLYINAIDNKDRENEIRSTLSKLKEGRHLIHNRPGSKSVSKISMSSELIDLTPHDLIDGMGHITYSLDFSSNLKLIKFSIEKYMNEKFVNINKPSIEDIFSEYVRLYGKPHYKSSREHKGGTTYTLVWGIDEEAVSSFKKHKTFYAGDSFRFQGKYLEQTIIVYNGGGLLSEISMLNNREKYLNHLRGM